MGKICVIHTEKHDLVIAHCYVDYNNVLNMVKNFHEENLPGHFLCMFKQCLTLCLCSSQWYRTGAIFGRAHTVIVPVDGV